jgi:MOSC domain-containing protein YiiM
MIRLMQSVVGTLLGLAVRSAPGGPMIELCEVRVTASGGLQGDIVARPDRGVTLLAAGQWATVQRELHADLPWHSRRANVLIDSAALSPLIGRAVAVGDVRIHLLGETRPCEMMDRTHPGLKAALMPECRGGVHGRILRSGVLRVGDAMVLVEPA